MRFLPFMFLLIACGEVPVDTDGVERELDETQDSADDLTREIRELRVIIQELEKQLEKCEDNDV